MTRQQRRYRERELNEVAKGMTLLVNKENKTIVDDNQFNFLKEKAERLRRSYNEDAN